MVGAPVGVGGDQDVGYSVGRSVGRAVGVAVGRDVGVRVGVRVGMPRPTCTQLFGDEANLTPTWHSANGPMPSQAESYTPEHALVTLHADSATESVE